MGGSGGVNKKGKSKDVAHEEECGGGANEKGRGNWNEATYKKVGGGASEKGKSKDVVHEEERARGGARADEKGKDREAMHKEASEGGENQEGSGNEGAEENVRKSTRHGTKSRKIQERQDYEESVTQANDLNRAKKHLKQEWLDFERIYPPAYVSTPVAARPVGINVNVAH